MTYPIKNTQAIKPQPNTAPLRLDGPPARLRDTRIFESQQSIDEYEKSQWVRGWTSSFTYLSTDALGRDLYEITRIAR